MKPEKLWSVERKQRGLGMKRKSKLSEDDELCDGPHKILNVRTAPKKTQDFPEYDPNPTKQKVILVGSL